jgi:saccharopine dehydrogenase (NAD+, L-lysine-forming)
MKDLLVGVGGVGESISLIAKDQAWVEKMVLADYSSERLKEVQARIPDKGRFPMEHVDAANQDQIVELAKKYHVDLIMNACDPSFVESIFDATFTYGSPYMDMAMSLSIQHPQDP